MEALLLASSFALANLVRPRGGAHDQDEASFQKGQERSMVSTRREVPSRAWASSTSCSKWTCPRGTERVSLNRPLRDLPCRGAADVRSVCADLDGQRYPVRGGSGAKLAAGQSSGLRGHSASDKGSAGYCEEFPPKTAKTLDVTSQICGRRHRRGDRMRRRTFLSFIGGAVALPLAAAAQTSEVVKRVAIADPAQATTEMIETGKSAFYRGFFGELRRLGFVEGQNLIVERYSGHGSANLPDLAREVVLTKPDLILGFSRRLVQRLSAATSDIPIIVGGTLDPVGHGIADSLARPGRNVTGITLDAGLATL